MDRMSSKAPSASSEAPSIEISWSPSRIVPPAATHRAAGELAKTCVTTFCALGAPSELTRDDCVILDAYLVEHGHGEARVEHAFDHKDEYKSGDAPAQTASRVAQLPARGCLLGKGSRPNSAHGQTPSRYRLASR